MINYKASKTTSSFHNCKAQIRGLMGAMGSGKSSACCAEIIRLMHKQPVSSDGKMYSSWGIIRRFYTNLKTTTVKTWLYWARDLGTFSDNFKLYKIRTKNLHVDIHFIALDHIKDEQRLKSLELTGAWVNEAIEIEEYLINVLLARIGRYNPPFAAKNNNKYLIMDTNPPNTDNWWYRRFELRENIENKEDWKIFKQPSGLSPEAENIENLPKNYYQDMQKNNNEAYCRVNLHGEYGFLSSGKSVYPEFNSNKHVIKENFTEKHAAYINYVVVGLDFGRTPAAAYMFRLNGKWIIFNELCFNDMGCEEFGEHLQAYEQEFCKKYKKVKFYYFGDPSADFKASSGTAGGRYDNTFFDILRHHCKIEAKSAWHNNDISVRRETLRHLLYSQNTAIEIHQNCRILIEGLGGGFCYKRVNIQGGSVAYSPHVDKNKYSHICEALEYALLGAREDQKFVKGRQYV